MVNGLTSERYAPSSRAVLLLALGAGCFACFFAGQALGHPGVHSATSAPRHTTNAPQTHVAAPPAAPSVIGAPVVLVRAPVQRPVVDTSVRPVVASEGDSRAGHHRDFHGNEQRHGSRKHHD